MSAPVLIGEHKWVGAAVIALSTKEARSADHRGSYRVETKQRVDVLEVYCKVCRRNFEDVKDTRCEVGQVLRGGPIDTRKRAQTCDDDEGLLALPRTLRASGG